MYRQQYENTRSKYLHGNACVSEVMEALGRIIDDAGGTVDIALDLLRKTNPFEKDLGILLSSYATTNITQSSPIAIPWGEAIFNHGTIVIGEKLTFPDFDTVTCEGFDSNMIEFWEKSTVPTKPTSYSILRLNEDMNSARWYKYLDYRGLASANFAELVNAYRFFPTEHKSATIDIRVPIHENDPNHHWITTYGVKLSHTLGPDYKVVRRNDASFILRGGDHMLVKTAT